MTNLIELGSRTAKEGFKNEIDIINKFNNWRTEEMAQAWLTAMNYNLSEIEFVKAIKIKGNFKADLQVQISIEIKLKKLIDVQNLSVKLLSNKSGFNQIDKRWIDKYTEIWNIPHNVSQILKYFTGEISPYIENPRDKRRMFIDEFSKEKQDDLINFIKRNQSLIVSDILKGRGEFCVEWMLVVLKSKNDTKWALKNINFCLNLFGNGEISITKQGSIKIGNITMQRKGGDGGRKTAQMLQFKINPCLLI